MCVWPRINNKHSLIGCLSGCCGPFLHAPVGLSARGPAHGISVHQTVAAAFVVAGTRPFTACRGGRFRRQHWPVWSSHTVRAGEGWWWSGYEFSQPPGSRIRIKEFKYFNPKNCFQALGNMMRLVHPGSGSWFSTHHRKFTGSLDPGSGSATLEWRMS